MRSFSLTGCVYYPRPAEVPPGCCERLGPDRGERSGTQQVLHGGSLAGAERRDGNGGMFYRCSLENPGKGEGRDFTWQDSVGGHWQLTRAILRWGFTFFLPHVSM